TPRLLHSRRLAEAGGSAGRRVSRVLSRRGLATEAATAIYLAPRLPVGSSSLPGDRNGPGRSCPLLGLAPGGVCRAGRSPGRWCALTLRSFAPHHFTLTSSSFVIRPLSLGGDDRLDHA